MARIGWALASRRLAGGLLAAALLAVAMLAAVPPAPAVADGGWWADLDKGQNVSLADVLASPEPFRGRSLTFTCVFHQREKEFNPLRTRFNAERFDNVSVWPDGRALWLASDFEHDFPFLYVARAHAQHDDLLRTTTFTRLEVTGRIEAVLAGSPFIEVTSFHATGHRLGKDVVEKMLRAETYANSGDASAKAIAVDNAKAALEETPDLAPIYGVRIRARLLEWLQSLGREGEAGQLRDPTAGAAAGLPGDPGREDLRPPDAPSDIPRGGNIPGEPTDLPALPRGGSMPGEPKDPPALPRGGNIPGEPADLPALPLGGSPGVRAAEPPPPAAPPAAPTGPFRPSLPGVPSDEPAPPPGSSPPAALGPLPLLPPAPAAAPEVVDPPLPPPAKNGAPPARRPRLAGVK